MLDLRAIEKRASHQMMLASAVLLLLFQQPRRDPGEQMRILEKYLEQQREADAERPYHEAQAAEAAKEAMIADLAAMDAAIRRLIEWNIKNPDIVDAKMQAEENQLARKAEKSIRRYLGAAKTR